MLFYEHDLYKRKKIVRDKIKQYFEMSDDRKFKILKKENPAAASFINSCIMEFIEFCEGDSISYSSFAKRVLYNHRMTGKDNLKENTFYFMTNTEIKKHLKKVDYKVIRKEAMVSCIFETAGHYGYYHLVFIGDFLNE